MERDNGKQKSIFFIVGAVLAVVALLFACVGAVIDWDWQQKDQFARDYSEQVLQELKVQLVQLQEQAAMEETTMTVKVPFDECDPGTTVPAPEADVSEESDLYSVIPENMPYMVVNDINYLGILTIPDISLSLPVILLDEWVPEMMDYAPCTYDGSLKTHDLIIMAHNYESHFRPILNLVPGQSVYLFTADGLRYTYTITAVDVMHRSQREKLYEGEWDLTLFTCVPQTYNRCAVRCKLVTVEKPDQ